MSIWKTTRRAGCVVFMMRLLPATRWLWYRSVQLEFVTGFGADPPKTARIHIIKKSPMKTDLSEILDLDVYPIDDQLFGRQCRQTLTEEGVLVLPGFVRAAAVHAKQSQCLSCTFR